MRSRPKIVVTQPIFPDVRALLARECEVVVNPGPGVWDRETLLNHACEADGLMVFMPDRVDRDLLDRCPKLRVIGAALKGYDNFDVAACTERGIWFTIVPDLLTQPTAELALTLMLGLARNVRAGDESVRIGAFAGWRAQLYGGTVMDAAVGMLGCGKVGQALGQLLTPFRCRLVVHDPGITGGLAGQGRSVEFASVEEVLACSDFVLPLLPLTVETFHLMDRARLALMRPTAYLVNVGRGSVVDEEAVADALETGCLAGYAADVFEFEDWARENRPREVSRRLLAHPQTLFTPHLGSGVARARLAIERAAAGNILQALRGERPTDAVSEIGMASLPSLREG